MEDANKIAKHNAMTELHAKTVEDGDYCRYYREVIRVKEGVTKLCDACPIRCVHSGSKLERDNLLKKK